MSETFDADALQSIVASHNNTLSQVTVKAVGSQLALMTGISLATVAAFSFFRPREKKVYAPKIKYQLPAPEHPLDNPDYEPPPPTISNGFFAWFSPVVHLKEEQMIANIGLDATTFLRFIRMLRNIFTILVIPCAGLMTINIIYNLKYVESQNRTSLNLLTIQNVSGNWMWVSLGMSYIFNFIIMYFIWRNWQAMVQLRIRWFRSPAYQTKIYSRTLMITHVRKDFRSDEGLVALMGKLKVDGIKIGPEIDCTAIGRRLENFPAMVEDHNEAVKELEAFLVKYLKGGKMANKRPILKKGGFLGMGGEKKDAIDYLAQQIKFLRDKIDEKRRAIDSLLKQERKARKSGKPTHRVEGENYGFVTFKTIAEAHRIAQTHRGKQKELHGAELALAPMPLDIVWENISKEPGEVATRRGLGFLWIALVCFFNTIPLLFVSALANLGQLTIYISFLGNWQRAGRWGDWSFSIVSGVLPSVIAVLFGYFLPIVIRKISKYQGAPTRSRLDRAVTARYFFFIIVSNLFIFTLLGVVYASIATVVTQIGEHKSVWEVFNGLKEIPYKIQGTYVQQSTYWLTWLPLRGFLVFFELIQLIKLALVSLRRVMFRHTPREVRDMTKPGYFDYPVVSVNLLFVCAVGLIYAPLAPLVAIGATAVFWFSSVVYKYQLLYVYISRAESGGRMWNVYVNRLITCAVLMQLLMLLTTALVRRRWLDSIAAVPPILIMLAFKIYMSRTAEAQFRYYKPTPEEAETERRMSMSEKRTRHSEMEKRFLHPALQHDKLYQIMVHKSQESLAREVLSAYPWFAGKNQEIKAVREENLEYDPTADGGKSELNWDARSVASTDMLGGKSEFATPYMTPKEEYDQYPMPHQGMYGQLSNNDSSVFNVPLDNPSSEHLVGMQQGRSEQYGPRRQASRPYPSHVNTSDSISAAPLLDHVQPTPLSPPIRQASGGVPYPPTAFTSPPNGYTPPMRRQASAQSDASWDRGDLGNATPQSAQGPYSYAYSQPQPQARGHAQGQGSGDSSRIPSRGTSPAGYADPYRGHAQGQGSGGTSRDPSRVASPVGYADPYDAYDRMAGPPGSGTGYPTRR